VGDRLVNTAVAAAALAVTILALEGIARVMEGSTAEGGTTFADYSEYDPLLGWRKRPRARLVFQRREYAVQFALNSHGLRDRERGYEAPPETARILALGDSFVEGFGVALEETVTQVLEAFLRRSGHPVEVVNGATTGYSTDQEYLFYQTEGVRYSPKVVVLFFYYNDILYNERQQYMGGLAKPVFVFRDGGLRLYRSPVPRPSPTPVPPARGAAEADAESPSALVRWIQERLWFGAPRAYNALGRLGLWAPNRPLGARLEIRVYEKRRIPEIEGAWEKTAGLLAELAREASSHRARLLVAYVPSRMEVNDRAWQLTRERDGMDEKGWDRGLVARRLGEIGREVGIPVLDLTPALRRADRGVLGGPYYTYDGHWNALGHQIAAEEVGRFLQDQSWLAP
jgi:lysophospholipase L1-like esterase